MFSMMVGMVVGMTIAAGIATVVKLALTWNDDEDECGGDEE